MEVLNDDILDVYNNFERLTYLQTFKKSFPGIDFITLSTNECLFGHNTINICKYHDQTINIPIK